MQTSRTVTVIPPTVGRLATEADTAVKMKSVAAYARVSTDTDEQLSSYEAQVDYYTRHIHQNYDHFQTVLLRIFFSGI